MIMRQIGSIIFIVVILLSSNIFAQNKSDNQIINIAICTSIDSKQPIGIDSVFASNVGKLYCFTKIKVKAEASVISHIWFYEGNEMAKIDLTMKAQTARTWSAKTIIPEWKGNWKVEIRDSVGNRIGNISFIVK
jgi:hypothetical protein